MSVFGFGKLRNNKKNEVEGMNEIRENNSDLEYLVFPNKGVVVCKIHNCRDIVLNRIARYTLDDLDLYWEKYLIPDVFFGVAKCNKEDKWDEEYGKKLALVKAKAKRCRAVNNMVKQYIRDKEKELETLRRYGIRNVPDPKQV